MKAGFSDSIVPQSAIRNPQSEDPRPPRAVVKAHNEKTRYFPRLGPHSERPSSYVVGRDHPRVSVALPGVLRLPARTSGGSRASAHAGRLQRPAIDRRLASVGSPAPPAPPVDCGRRTAGAVPRIGRPVAATG